MRWPTTLGILSLCVGLACTVPAQVAGRDARRFYDDDAATQLALAAGVARAVRDPVGLEDFHTVATLFDSEWVFGSYMMAAMGLGQVALTHPQARARYSPVVAHCLDQLLSKRVRAFDRHAWGSDPLTSLDTAEGHVAYLGYMNLALGIHRQLEPSSRFAGWHDRISAALARRLGHSPHGLVATYPGELYPVDTMAAVASVALHSRLTGAGREALVARLIAQMRTRFLDPDTGLLIQRATVGGKPGSDGRGSGTALAAYFAAWADPRFAADLHTALARHLATDTLGFGTVHEYADDIGAGDIDSGPLLFGLSVSATGFSLGSARAAGDFAHFARVFRTAHLFGAPVQWGGASTFVGGGPLGNAIMLAMLTTPRGVSP
jgi:hypothetical protein